MALKQNTAEGGTNGTAVTTSNSGGASGDAFGQVTLAGSPTFVFANNAAMHGALSYRVSGVNGDTAKGYLFNTAGSVAASRLYIYLNSLPTGGSMNILNFQASDFSFSGQVTVNTAGNILVQDATASTTLYTSPSSLQLNQWYRVEFQIAVGTTTSNGMLAFQYYSGDGTTALGTYSSSTVNAGTQTIIRAVFGKQASTPVFDANFDDIAIDTSTSTPLGPAGVSNQAPTANAGLDQSNVEAWSIVTLDGSGSSDPDGAIASYVWTQTAGTTVSLSSATAAQPTFTAPGNLANSTLTFSLTVTDNGGTTSTADTVNISVLAATERAAIGGAEVPVHTQVVSGGTLV